MAGSIHFHCPQCDAVRSADPLEVTTCAACGHSFKLGDGKTIVRPALPEAAALAEQATEPVADTPADPARVAAMQAVLERVSAAPAAPDPLDRIEEKAGGWGGTIAGIVIAAAGIPAARWASGWHEMAGVLVGFLLWAWGAATIYAGLRIALGGKMPLVIAGTVAGVGLAYLGSFALSDLFGMTPSPAPARAG